MDEVATTKKGSYRQPPLHSSTNTRDEALRRLAKGRETRRKNREKGILTGRRLLFAEAMIDPSCTPAKAYKQAGYEGKDPHKAGWTMMADPLIKRWIEKRRAAVGERNNVTEDEVIKNLRHLRDSAEADGNWGAAIRATELLGKFIKMFDQKVTVEHHENPLSVFISSAAPEDRAHQVSRLSMIGGTVVDDSTQESS